MKRDFIATPTRTKQIISKYAFQFKKSLGQNFIVDTNILRKMIHFSGIHDAAGVIEIGPGIGSLTEQLALHAKKVIALEIDQRLLPILQTELAAYDQVTILHADVLKTDIAALIERHFAHIEDIYVVANLPYYVTTPIIMHLLAQHTRIKQITVMLQKEVAERIVAKPNTKAYGSLSIAVQYYTVPQIVMDVPKTVFIPQPKVTSSILTLTMRATPPVTVRDAAAFFQLVQACFAYRRKTLRNNLQMYLQKQNKQVDVDAIFAKANIDAQRRAESLTIEEFATLFSIIDAENIHL